MRYVAPKAGHLRYMGCLEGLQLARCIGCLAISLFQAPKQAVQLCQTSAHRCEK